MTDHTIAVPVADEPDGPDAPASTDNEGPAVPDAPPQGPKQLRRRRFALGGFIVTSILIAASFLIRLPYYTEAPGSVRETESRIAVAGRQAFDADGEVYFTTVSQRRATPYELLVAWFDDAIDVEPESEIYPSGNTTEVRIVNQKMMDDSKFDATIAALTELKLPVSVKGDGAFINAVLKDSNAASVIRQGDVITAINGSAVTTGDELRTALEPHAVGEAVDVKVRRASSGVSDEVSVELIKNDDDLSRGYLGVSVETSNARLDLPFRLDIDSGEVTGPSAGLAWSLGIVDRLTPGELTGGRKVAVTGTISPDGKVGPIGGIAQKISAVKREGVKVFLYPASTNPDELERVRDIAGETVELHPVATLAEALAVLAPDGVPPPPGT